MNVESQLVNGVRFNHRYFFAFSKLCFRKSKYLIGMLYWINFILLYFYN